MLKRAAQSLKKKWFKNLMIVILFTVMFTVAVGSLTLYFTITNQINFLTKYVKNSVAISITHFHYKAENSGIGSAGIDEAVINKFFDSE